MDKIKARLERLNKKGMDYAVGRKMYFELKDMTEKDLSLYD